METITIYNCETSEEINRPMTDEELAVLNESRQNAQLRTQQELEAVAKREALLNRLGITAEEARLLLN